MTEKEKASILTLGEQLSTAGVEFRMAQIGLERMVEQHGMSSPEAVEAAELCSTLALQFSALEEEFLSLLTSGVAA